MVLTASRNLASKHTCAVCYSGVDNNSSQCSQCKLWVHKRWSTTTDWQVDDRNYVCPRFHGKVRPIDGRPLDVGGLCLIWRPPFATWVVCCAPVWVVGHCRQVLCDLREVQETLSCPHGKVHGKVHTSCVYSAIISSTVAKYGDQTPLTGSSFSAITAPWSVESVAPKAETKHPWLPCSRKLALRILRPLQSRRSRHVSRSVSNQSQT